MSKKSLFEKAKQLASLYDGEGALIIVHKKNGQGQLIAQFGLSHKKCRECLAIATYYNEKIELQPEGQVQFVPCSKSEVNDFELRRFQQPSFDEDTDL